MQTALHEMAHGLLGGGVNDHEVGRNVSYEGATWRTPMAKQEIVNECGQHVGDRRYGYWAMHFSDCCYSKMG